MRNIAIVAEGFGDVAALPSLVARTAAAFGHQVFASHTVRAGGWSRLRQAGQLERFCRLAGSHNGVSAVIVIVDLDDGCAKEQYIYIKERLHKISSVIRLPVELCFCIREFEAWLLEDFINLKEHSQILTGLATLRRRQARHVELKRRLRNCLETNIERPSTKRNFLDA